MGSRQTSMDISHSSSPLGLLKSGEFENFDNTSQMSPCGTSKSDESQKKKNGRFSSAAKGIVGAFGSCLSPNAHKAKQNDITQFKDISVSSVGTDHSKSMSVFSYKSSKSHSYNPGANSGLLTFTMSELSKATGNFSLNNKIGQGGFGTVYKGKLKDGTMVAIKRAKKNIYDKHLSVEFQSEIRTLSSIEHLNLVRFLGYYEDQHERILVIEHVPNGTLREHLDCLHGTILDLATRLDIAIDVAHAITYLHMYTDQPIIHRDIKSSNILLSENFRAKVADFGFSRLAPTGDVGATHVSTQVKGTAGYLDPEYLKTYQLTYKSDVYSFGVLLVEILTGRRPIEQKRELKERITIRWALKKFMEGDGILILDPKLPRSPAASLVVEKILELAFQCSAPSKQDRPGMKKAAEMLWNIRKEYRELLAANNGDPAADPIIKIHAANSVSRHSNSTIPEERSADFKSETDKSEIHSL